MKAATNLGNKGKNGVKNENRIYPRETKDKTAWNKLKTGSKVKTASKLASKRYIFFSWCSTSQRTGLSIREFFFLHGMNDKSPRGENLPQKMHIMNILWTKDDRQTWTYRVFNTLKYSIHIYKGCSRQKRTESYFPSPSLGFQKKKPFVYHASRPWLFW